MTKLNQTWTNVKMVCMLLKIVKCSFCVLIKYFVFHSYVENETVNNDQTETTSSSTNRKCLIYSQRKCRFSKKNHSSLLHAQHSVIKRHQSEKK